MRRVLIAFFILIFSGIGIAQRTNTFYAAEYDGATAGAKIAAAQNSCSTAVPCIIVIDSILSAYPAGTNPTKCGNCTWVDWRSGGFASGGTGDVLGAASSVNGNIVSFNGTGGKTIQDSGIAAASVTKTIASGQTAMRTLAIASGTCDTVLTISATGTAASDVVTLGFSGDPTAITGYTPATTGTVTVYAYPTANNVNFKVCNPTAASITPGAIAFNWRVVR
jgi:hypothetical protein